MATLPINSKLDVRKPIPKTRQHGKKEIWKKLKVIMTNKVIMIAEKGRQNVSLSHINIKKSHEKGDFWRTFSRILENFYFWTFAP